MPTALQYFKGEVPIKNHLNTGRTMQKKYGDFLNTLREEGF